MIRKKKRQKPFLSEINVIPYVDVSLVLLVIFMVATPFMIQGVDLNLPKEDSKAIKKANQDNLTISISETGEYYLDIGGQPKKFSSSDKVFQEIKKILKNNQALEIFVRADQNSLYKRVIEVLSEIQKYKAGSVNLITEPKSDK